METFSGSDLMNIRQQMAFSLERMKELEEQVKLIPIFQFDGEKELVVIETNHQLLKGKYTELANLDEQILNSLLESDASENELSSEIASADEYKANWATMCIRFGRFKSGDKENLKKDLPESTRVPLENTLANNSCPEVLLQTLTVRLKGERGNRTVRALVDTGSQRSYVLKEMKESFQDSKSETLKSLNLFVDAKDVLRLKTRISEREDVSYLRYPALLPSDHPVVNRLIHETHVKANHVQLSVLKEEKRKLLLQIRAGEIGWAGSPRHELARGGGPEMGCTLWANEINRRRVKALADQWGPAWVSGSLDLSSWGSGPVGLGLTSHVVSRFRAPVLACARTWAPPLVLMRSGELLSYAQWA
uniref:Peptidase aspartic putative domain-containing protein n=1 Tax=Timema poppense TaxID=170557 RepID=A0A7R9HBR0_TIMPO|nr:unnamed protein product [Timema poppensis]